MSCNLQLLADDHLLLRTADLHSTSPTLARIRMRDGATAFRHSHRPCIFDSLLVTSQSYQHLHILVALIRDARKSTIAFPFRISFVSHPSSRNRFETCRTSAKASIAAAIEGRKLRYSSYREVW